MTYTKTYSKDLRQPTSIRLSHSERDQAERAATFLGISFSDFVRQSINRNINVYSDVEREVLRQSSLITRGIR